MSAGDVFFAALCVVVMLVVLGHVALALWDRDTV